MTSPRLVVVTGGPGSGKTTLVEALGRRGHPIVREAAIEVIESLNRELGVEGQKTWRRANLTEFQDRILLRQIELEAAVDPAARFAFLDRGRYDGLAYCRHFDVPAPARFETLGDDLPYGRVFVLDTLSDFADRSATGRTSDRATSIALGDAIERTYTEIGLAPLRVPELSVEDRAAFVLDALGAS